MGEAVQLVLIDFAVFCALHPHGEIRFVADDVRHRPLILQVDGLRRRKIAIRQRVPRAARWSCVVDLRHQIAARILWNVRGHEIPDLWIAVQQRHQIVGGRDIRAALRRLAFRPGRGDHLLGDEDEHEDQQHECHQNLD